MLFFQKYPEVISSFRCLNDSIWTSASLFVAQHSQRVRKTVSEALVSCQAHLRIDDIDGTALDLINKIWD
jgi:hypothetical protein